MEFITKPPDWLRNLIPEANRNMMGGIIWILILVVGAIIALVILTMLLKAIKGFFVQMFRGAAGQHKVKKIESNLEEHLAEYPRPKPSTGDRQLLIERVPCRLRLVAIAPAGKADEIDEDEIAQLLDRVVNGLGDIFKGDKPRVRIWPYQVSYQGFATHFHRNTIVPEAEDEGEPTPWVVVAGRCKLGKQQIMLGLAALAVKPTTVGRRTYDSHEWAAAVRVRIQER